MPPSGAAPCKSSTVTASSSRPGRDPVFLDGPWDLTIDDHGSEAHIFVSNVLNGTVSRLDVSVTSSAVTLQKMTTLATGYSHVPNAAAVVLGPTGLAFDAATDTLVRRIDQR